MATEYSGSGDITRSMELLWGTQDRPSRGPKPSLTLDKIVDAAIGLADAEDIGAVSMRRVAGKLNVGTMSLYRYIPSKAELLDLMIDRIQGELLTPQPDTGVGWRKGLEQVARGTWDLFQRHHWLLHVSEARPLLGPNSTRGTEYALAVLAGSGLTDHERMCAIVMVYGYVTGHARNHIDSLLAAERTGVPDEQFWKAQEPFLAEAMLSGEFPQMAALAPEIFGEVFNSAFDFGLQRMLDGLETYLKARR